MSTRIPAIFLSFLTMSSCAAEEAFDLKPRVIAGAGFLEKRLVSPTPSPGGIGQILIRGQRDGDREVVVVGTESASILETGTYRLKETIRLGDGKPPFFTTHALDADGDGRIEFFRGEEAALYDGGGRRLWRAKPPGRGFPRSAWGDLQGDGKQRFLLGSFPSDKVTLLDHSGKVIWSQVWETMSETLILDTNADGKAEILSIDGKALSVRDGDGKLLRRQPIEGASYVNHLSRARYPDRNGRLSLAVGFNIRKLLGEPRQLYRILALDGTILKEIEPADLEAYSETLPVKLGAARGNFHAAIWESREQAFPAGFSSTRLVLSLYEPDGPLVYREVIRSSQGDVAQGDGAVAVVPGPDGTERLLVGYGPDLWEYSLPRR
jgi:hypothetical protein